MFCYKVILAYFPLSYSPGRICIISSINFSSDDIAKIIQNLDPNKAHGHDIISTRVLKIRSNSNYKPLQKMFRSCIERRKFPSEWNSFIKKIKKSLENYRLVFLLPILLKCLNV